MNKYIYAHLENGEPVYVGVGDGGRAWTTVGSTRYGEHKEWMMQQLPENLEVQIVASNLTKEEAHSLERQLIFELKPKFNKKIPRYKSKFDPAVLNGYRK